MRWLPVLFASLLLYAEPSSACSVVEGYKTPTNFELVKESSVIVLARVKDVPAMDAASSPFEHPGVTLEPIRFLKGSAAPDQLRLMGWLAPGNWSGVPTTTTLAQAHWSTGIGGCIRQFYSPGELVVAMFRTDSEAKKATGLDLVQVFQPFARAVETVDDPNDVWVHAVERYVALQAGPAATVGDRIGKAIGELNRASNSESQAIAEDLQYHLSRKDPENVWTNFSTPMSTTAGVLGHTEFALYCLAGTPPGILVRGAPPSRIEVRVGQTSLVGIPASPSPVEKKMMGPELDPVSGGKDTEKRTLLHFADKQAAITAIRNAIGPVDVSIGGRPFVSGQPLDALLRWSSQCAKLETLPAPTEAELHQPAM